MQVLVLPVSGGSFCAQLSILQHLCNAKYRPDISMGSSGGNLAAYVAAAADWNSNGILRVAGLLHHDLFATEWSANPTVSKVVGFFKGYACSKGVGVLKLIESLFSQDSIGKYEIWTGTYNNTKKKARLFCNRSADTALSCSCLDTNLYQCLPSVYMDCNLDLIAKAGIASVSIPCVVPAQEIEGEMYVDGGIYSASPLSLMQDCLWREARIRGIHIVYVNSFDMNEIRQAECNNVVDMYRQATRDIVRSQIIMDRVCAHRLINAYAGGELGYTEFRCNDACLALFFYVRQNLSCSLLEIYPVVNSEINLLNFTGETVLKAMNQVYDYCMCKLWWNTRQIGLADMQAIFSFANL